MPPVGIEPTLPLIRNVLCHTDVNLTVERETSRYREHSTEKLSQTLTTTSAIPSPVRRDGTPVKFLSGAITTPVPVKLLSYGSGAIRCATEATSRNGTG